MLTFTAGPILRICASEHAESTSSEKYCSGGETGSIRCAVLGEEKPERVILTYRHRSGPSGEWEDVQEPMPLAWTACNFGGERPWFVCPGAGCGRRAAVLYGPGKYFLCRHCYDLRYE